MVAKVTAGSHRKGSTAAAGSARVRSTAAAASPRERATAATTGSSPKGSVVSAGSSPKGLELPAHATLKDISATYNQDTIPRQLRAAHSLPPDTWALVVVPEGEVEVRLDGRTIRAKAGAPVVVPPITPFALAAAGKHVLFSLHYYHEPVLQDGKALETMLGRRVA